MGIQTVSDFLNDSQSEPEIEGSNLNSDDEKAPEEQSCID